MNTPRFRTLLAAASLSLALFSPAAEAARVVVKVAPPVARVEVRAVAPSHAHVWVNGYWRWNGSAHVWVAGAWRVPPRPGVAWADGHWKKTPGGWVWIDGHWR